MLGCGFQSTLPHGERPAHGWRLCLRKVSIHAPTWGATKIDHAGENNKMFQSTLPHGERLTNMGKMFFGCSFNPRSHMGSDANSVSCALRNRCFNPRSHMGSDTPKWVEMARNLGFNPRSHMGSDDAREIFSNRERCFNPRSHMGSDKASDVIRVRKQSFNPRSHMGSDRTFFIFLFYNELQHNFCERAECNNLYIIISTI